MKAREITQMKTVEVERAITEWGQVHGALTAFIKQTAPHLSEFDEAVDNDNPHMAALKSAANRFVFEVKAVVNDDTNNAPGVGVLSVDGVPTLVAQWDRNDGWELAVMDATRAESILEWANDCLRRPIVEDNVDAEFLTFADSLEYRLTPDGFVSTGVRRMAHVTIRDDIRRGAVLDTLSDGTYVLWTLAGTTEFVPAQADLAVTSFLEAMAELGKELRETDAHPLTMFCHLEGANRSFAVQRQKDEGEGWMVATASRSQRGSVERLLEQASLGDAVRAFSEAVASAFRDRGISTPGASRFSR